MKLRLLPGSHGESWLYSFLGLQTQGKLHHHPVSSTVRWGYPPHKQMKRRRRPSLAPGTLSDTTSRNRPAQEPGATHVTQRWNVVLKITPKLPKAQHEKDKNKKES